MGFVIGSDFGFWVLGGNNSQFKPQKMIDSREYPPEEKENQCGFCGEDSDGKFCCKECEKAYKSEN